MYVNPAPHSGRRRALKGRRVRPLKGATLGSTSSRRKRVRKHGRKVAVVVKARRATKRKGIRMARKLYGAAAKAHAKRLAKTRRKRNPSRKRAGARRRRRNPGTAAAAPTANPRRRRRKRRNPALSYALNPRRKRRKARKNPRRRRRRNPAAYAAGYEKTFGKPKRRRRRARKSSAATLKRRRRSYYKRTAGRKRRPGIRALARARRSIKRAYRRGGRSLAYARRHHMRTNPRRRRHHRRNPGLAGTPGMLMKAVKAAVPIAASLYITRFLVNKFGPSIPGVNQLGQFSKPAVAGLAVVAANFATKKGPLAKYRQGIMLGTSLNLVDTLVSAFAPQSIRTMFGLGDGGMYDQAMGEFVTVGDYLEVGATPIDDDIALSDYVSMSGVEEELGALQEELGVEEELGNGSPFGDSGPNRLGGVGQSSMLKAIKAASAVGVVPQRSFTRQVPHAGQGYDNPGLLYTGIFSGGW